MFDLAKITLKILNIADFSLKPFNSTNWLVKNVIYLFRGTILYQEKIEKMRYKSERRLQESNPRLGGNKK